MTFFQIKISIYFKELIYIEQKTPKGYEWIIHCFKNQNNETKLEDSMATNKYLFWSQNKYGGIVFPENLYKIQNRCLSDTLKILRKLVCIFRKLVYIPTCKGCYIFEK